MSDQHELTRRLAAAGFIAADEESQELLDAAKGDDDVLVSLFGRRLSGEPLAWITGSTNFCGLKVHVALGVYVPRWQSEPLAERAIDRGANRLHPGSPIGNEIAHLKNPISATAQARFHCQESR